MNKFVLIYVWKFSRQRISFKGRDVKVWISEQLSISSILKMFTTKDIQGEHLSYENIKGTIWQTVLPRSGS